jgi:hypothetical protein
MISYIDKDVMHSMVAGVGGPKIVHQGRRFTSIIPPAKWEKVLALKLPKAGFSCSRCEEPVFVNPKSRTQACRCAEVAHGPGCEFSTAEGWDQWQCEFDQELKDPPPDPYWIKTGPNTEGSPVQSGQIMTSAAKAWFKRKFKLPSELEISDDGRSLNLPGVTGTLRVGRSGNLTTVFPEDDTSTGWELFEISKKILTARESPPQIMIILGDDPDYVWPPFTDRHAIRSLPFKCTRCGQRVKQAPVIFGQVLVCFCLQVGYPRGSDKTPPRSRLEWDTLRLDSATEATRKIREESYVRIPPERSNPSSPDSTPMGTTRVAWSRWRPLLRSLSAARR